MKNLSTWSAGWFPGLMVALSAARHFVTEESKAGDSASTSRGGEQRLLGCYEIEQELGRGATGIVYRAKDPLHDRTVAIKTLVLAQECETGERRELSERFLREAEIAGCLSHPHVVTIFDIGTEHDLAYIAMEFVPSGDLTPYLKPDNRLPLPRAMHLIARVATALHYAHANGVVHRDIKPSNILYEPASDTVKVTDFGIGLIPDASRTRAGRVLGTPSYMSPEQLAGRDIDHRSDLFSLGVTFYQLVSGQFPFPGDSLPQRVLEIAHEPPIDILTYNAKLPPCLVGIINKALAKHPAGRYQSGNEMAQAIEACADAMGGSRSAREWRTAPRGTV